MLSNQNLAQCCNHLNIGLFRVEFESLLRYSFSFNILNVLKLRRLLTKEPWLACNNGLKIFVVCATRQANEAGNLEQEGFNFAKINLAQNQIMHIDRIRIK